MSDRPHHYESRRVHDAHGDYSTLEIVYDDAVRKEPEPVMYCPQTWGKVGQIGGKVEVFPVEPEPRFLDMIHDVELRLNKAIDSKNQDAFDALWIAYNIIVKYWNAFFPEKRITIGWDRSEVLPNE